MSEAQDLAVDIVIDHVLHELRRAVKGPIYRVGKGGIAPLHDIAVGFGWLRPAAALSWSVKRRRPPPQSMLALTPAGKQALLDDQRRREAA